MNTKDLKLTPRIENTREKYHTNVVLFGLDEIMQHFKESVDSITSLFHIADNLIDEGKSIDAGNIWRAQIVFLASAFDFYMHELSKYGLCEIYNNNWTDTDRYNNLQIRMCYIEKAFKAGGDIEWFLDYVNEHDQTITMISYAAVKNQLNLLGINVNKVANMVFYKQGDSEKPTDKLKNFLNALFARRNIIVHQTDRNQKNAQIKDITKETVDEFISTIFQIVEAINSVAKGK